MRFVVLKASSSIHLAHRCPSDHLADTTQGSLAINRLGPNRASGEVKLDCGKDTNWLLFDPKELQRFGHQKGGITKKSRTASTNRTAFCPSITTTPSTS